MHQLQRLDHGRWLTIGRFPDVLDALATMDKWAYDAESGTKYRVISPNGHIVEKEAP